jgi:hypothetical protein
MAITTTINPLDINNPSKEIFPAPLNRRPNLAWPYLSLDTGLNTNANVPSQFLNNIIIPTTTINPNSHTITPASGFWLSFQRTMQSGAIPDSLSSAKWTDAGQGFPQQTFLGASIRSFNMQGGFGDSSSSLTVDLIVDEYNPSDRTAIGKGDDVYHSGIIQVPDVNGLQKSIGDNFVPPIPGSPVFFKFGPNFATVEEAYRKTFDDLYRIKTIGDLPDIRSVGPNMDSVLGGSINLVPNQYVDLEEQGATIKFSNQPRGQKNYNSIRSNPLTRGVEHIVFGGILQTYTQSRSPAGNPLYTVNVIDPREILSNVTLILNNYAGPTYEQKNMLNIYGFLEYNPTPQAISQIKSTSPFENKLVREVLPVPRNVAGKMLPAGSILFDGDDKYYKTKPPPVDALKKQIKDFEAQIASLKRTIAEHRRTGNFAAASLNYAQIITTNIQLNTIRTQLTSQLAQALPSFPMTGTGFSRRSSQGIPYYRVKHAINALMEYERPLPQEYKEQGFGGRINFRGFNYVVDFSGLPELSPFYFLDFDEINLLELALEICDITNRDLFVSLLPVIDHPACKEIYNYNRTQSSLPTNLQLPPLATLPQNSVGNLVAGIIRLDAIDRSEQPFYGAVKTYIDDLAKNGIFVESQDLGYELSNVTTDRFIVGAQEVDMYFFSTNADRDTLAFKKTGRNGLFPNKPIGYQWTLEASLEQQVLPYYGKLGNAITIPKGFGAYQQILLDATGLNAAGVGAYYVATEMELRCALISFDRWKEFLKTYNDVYMDSVESDDSSDRAIVAGTPAQVAGAFNAPLPPVNISTNYAVTVPRSVFDTYAVPINGSDYGADGLPLSACNPPYGYPLYYKRMTRIGIPEGGLTDLFNRWTTLNTSLAELQSSDARTVRGIIDSQYQRLRDLKDSGQQLTQFEQNYFNEIERLMNQPTPPLQQLQNSFAALEDIVRGQTKNMFAMLPSVAKKNNQNALKVYNFVKQVAEDNLGKKFLVKIPNEVNVFYENEIKWSTPQAQEYIQGPFGFRPRSTKNIAGYEFSQEFKAEVMAARTPAPPAINIIQSFLNNSDPAGLPNPAQFIGALRVNFNPISQKYESNYTPVNIGGYFNFDLYQNTLGVSAIKDIGNASFRNLPSGVQQGLIPQDLTNFINEDGRVSAYVRFDNAEDLTLEGLNDGDFTQQIIVGNAMIPDLTSALDNTGPDQFHSFPNTDDTNNQQPTNKPKQIAFVKCSVEEELYFPPRFVQRDVRVHAQQVKDIGAKSIPEKIFIPCSGLAGDKLIPGTGVYVSSFSFYKANFVPLPIPGSTTKILDFERYNPALNLPGAQNFNSSDLVNSEFDQLNTNHAYALITLPNRILPNKDSRHRDGPFQSIDAEKFKHLMTMDVVRGLPGFNLPTNPMGGPPRGNLKPGDINVNINQKIHAWFAMKKVLAGLSFGFPQQVNVTMPSPVYPDLVCLSLMSNDRCYGPWVSSQLDGQAYVLKNIGGKVEFIKDENLSPWNYAGYELLNQAGRLRAEFSNSLLLFSERGAFTVPTIPKGNSLCKALIDGGPLVTSINVDVSTGGARTTYQMDLYTASFGKLQKQKQDEISKISRERKKLNSERNALIRKGLGKNQSARNFANEYNMMAQGVMPGLNEMNLGMVNSMTTLAASTSRETRNRWGGGGNFGSTGGNESIPISEVNVAGSIQDPTQIGKTAQLYNDQFQLAKNYQDSASRELFGENGLFAPMSHGYHANMTYRSNDDTDARMDLYAMDDEDRNNDFRNQITNYGDSA